MKQALARDIVNTHEQLAAAGGGVAIMVSYGGIRDRYVDGWVVYRLDARGVEVVTDKKAAWYNYGRKVFHMLPRHDHGRERPFAERRQEAFTRAQAWVAAQGWYDGAWKRNAQGDFVPADIAKRFPLRRRT